MAPKDSLPPARWEILGDTVHADCQVFDVVRRHSRHPVRGSEVEFFVVRAPDWVLALAEPEPGSYVLVNQFRFGAKELSWEFPAGTLEPGEDPVAGAARELQEETGYVSEGPGKLIGSSQPNPAIQQNRCWYVLFQNVRSTGTLDWDTHEELQSGMFTIEEIDKMVVEGAVYHSLAHAALYFLQRFKGGKAT